MSDARPEEPETLLLLEDIGTWDATIETRPPGAADLVRITGIAEMRASGGRWLVMDFRASSGDFEGHGVFGWDASRKTYAGVWVDTLRTAFAPMDGSWDAATRTMTYRGEATFGGRTMRWREVTERVDADTRIFRVLIAKPDGTETEQVKTTYKRRR